MEVGNLKEQTAATQVGRTRMGTGMGVGMPTQGFKRMGMGSP